MKNKYKEWLEITISCLKDIKEIFITEVYPVFDNISYKIGYVMSTLPFTTWLCLGIFKATGFSFEGYIFVLFLLFCPAYVFNKEMFKRHDFYLMRRPKDESGC